MASGATTDLRAELPRVADGLAVQGFDWSPDGSKVALSIGGNGHLISDLYVVRADGSAGHMVARGGRDIAWSPKGDWIVQRIERDSFGDPPRPCNPECSTLYAVRSDGSEERNLTDGVPYAVAPSWAPDGSRLAFRGATDDSGKTYLYITAVDQPAPALASGDEYAAPDPQIAWSPGGHAIFYLGYPQENVGLQCGQGGCNYGYLYMVDAAGSRASRQLYPERVSRITGFVP